MKENHNNFRWTVDLTSVRWNLIVMHSKAKRKQLLPFPDPPKLGKIRVAGFFSRLFKNKKIKTRPAPKIGEQNNVNEGEKKNY